MAPRAASFRGSRRRLLLQLGVVGLLAGACRSQPPAALPGSPTPDALTAFAAPTARPNPSANPVLLQTVLEADPPPGTTEAPASTPPSELPSAHNWRLWPEIPSISDTGREILLAGLRLDANPHAFSVVGDCQSMPPVFLGIYESPGRYRLPEDYAYLQEAINFFHGSFARQAITVQNGISAASVFSPLWADPERCNPSETPLQCEVRLNRPSFVLVNLGMNWPEGNVPRHNQLIRQILEYSIEHGVLPVLATQADTSGERELINEGIAQAAADYGIPLWNSWRAVQHLPGHGLDEERGGGYLTVDAWDARNFSALQVLYVIQMELLRLPPPAE